MMDVPCLALIIVITSSCFGSERSPCPPNQFFHPDGICCAFCEIGTYMFKPCLSPGNRPLCFPCDEGISYMDKPNNMTICKPCLQCDQESEVEESKCTFENNRRCVCREGFQKKANKCELEETTRGEPVSPDINLYPLQYWILLIGVLCVILFSLWRKSQSLWGRILRIFRKQYRVSRMNVDEDTENRVPEVRTLLDEHNERDAMENKLSSWRRRYAVYPTVDLNSANQQIVISSDLYNASMSGIDQQYPKHAQRFTSCKQVLAKESFFSGRYYWEVDVTRAHDYEIGIASESMFRIGDSWECLLGWNVNSWCVAKHDRKYTARHDGSETNLNMLGDPKHLGLCLDCDQGDLVFYAIDYGFSWPMHTCHINVKEPLRPALRLCKVGDALRFLSLQCCEDNYPGMLHL